MFNFTESKLNDEFNSYILEINMSYLKITDFEVNKKNPFVDELKGVVHIQTKNVFAGSAQKILVDNQTGDVEGQVAFIKFQKYDPDKFVKVFTNRIGAFFDLDKSSLKVLSYIMNITRPDLDYVIFDQEDCSEFTHYRSKATILSAVSKLIELKFIARSHRKDIYFINPSIFFNGDRKKVIFAVAMESDPSKTLAEAEMGNAEEQPFEE